LAHARERAAEAQASRLRRLDRLLANLAALTEDEALDAPGLRSRLRDLIAPFEAERRSTRVAEIRREFGHKSHELARLLNTVRATELAMPTEHVVATAFATLDALPASGPRCRRRRRSPLVLPGRASSISQTASQRSAAFAPAPGVTSVKQV
jgi:hypothetical protein